MTDNNEEIDNNVVVNDAPQPELKQDNIEPENEPNEKPEGKIEFSTPEQQKRFNDIYKQTKMSDARNLMLMDALARQNEVIEELKSRFNQTDHAEAERVLNLRLREARDTGDEEKADKILQEIIDFRAEAKIKQLTAKEKPVVAEPLPYTDDDVKTLVTFAQETDSSGQPLRPWIAQNHPKHQEAMKYAAIYAMEVNAEMGFVDIPETMKRVENAMKQQRRPMASNRNPDPMKSSLTNNNTKAKLSLSSKEAEVLSKLNAHLPSEKQVKPEGYLKWK